MYTVDVFKWGGMSPMRKNYFLKLAFRCFALVFSAVLCGVKPETFDVMEGMNFFKKFSILHVLWGLWFFDMILQLVPVEKVVPLGSHKLFEKRYIENKKGYDETGLKKYSSKEHKSALAIFIVWTVLTLTIGYLKMKDIIDYGIMFVITTFFYVSDLICVLIWCPFRVFMNNRCCTTCRIFNWDHMMMFSPFFFSKGFYGISLAVMAAIIMIIWECKVWKHPERFWTGSNDALKCKNCTDKLCSQYCPKK